MDKILDLDILNMAYKTTIAFVNSLGLAIDFQNKDEKLKTALISGKPCFFNVYDNANLNRGYIGTFLDKRVQIKLELIGYDIEGNIYFSHPNSVIFSLYRLGKPKMHSHFTIKGRRLGTTQEEYFAKVKLQPNDTMDNEAKIDIASGKYLFNYSCLNPNYQELVTIKTKKTGENLISLVSYKYQRNDNNIGFAARVINNFGKNNAFFTIQRETTFRSAKDEFLKDYPKNPDYKASPSLELNQMIEYMKEIYPDYTKIITDIDFFHKPIDWYYPLYDWFIRLFSLTYPEFSDEDIKTLFGISRENVIFQDGSKNLTQLYSSVSKLVRRKEK